MRVIPWICWLVKHLASKGLKRWDQVPVSEYLMVGVPSHVDGVSDNEPDLADELRRESFDPRRCEATGVKPVDCGGVDACLPYAQFVFTRKSMPASKDARQSTEVPRTNFHSGRQGAVFIVILTAPR